MRADRATPAQRIEAQSGTGRTREHVGKYVELLVLLLCALCCASVQVLKVGLHFNVFGEDGTTPDVDMAEALAAALLQIKTLNAANVANNVRMDAQVIGGLGFHGAVAAGIHFRDDPWTALAPGDSYLSGNIGVDVVITGGTDEETKALNMLFTDAEIVVIHTFSRDPLLEDGATYKYTVALTPPLSYQGVVWSDIFCKEPFKFSALSIFVVGDTNSIQSDQQFESGRTCSFNIKSRHILPTTSTDFSAEIAIAKNSGSNIFVIFGSPEATGALIQQAWQKGLFHEEILVVSGERATSPETWAAMKASSPLSVPLAMKGFLGIIYDPSFVLRGPSNGGTQMGADFVTAFHQIDANLAPCALQDAFLTYPFRGGGVSGGACLFTSTYFATNLASTDGSDIYPYAAHAFDAPLLFMNAFATMQNLAITGASLRDAILSLPSFPGASGDVKVFPGKPGDNTFNNRGSRLAGLTYAIFNFNQGQYQQHGDSIQAFSFNGIWTSQAGFTLCTNNAAVDWRTYSFEQTVCGPIVFNTANSTLPPVDHPPYSTSSLVSSPKIMKIGGIFSPIDDNGAFDANQAQALAAFIMAIRDINASLKVLKNIRLVYAIARAGTSFDGGVLAAQYLANTAFGALHFPARHISSRPPAHLSPLHPHSHPLNSCSPDSLLRRLHRRHRRRLRRSQPRDGGSQRRLPCEAHPLGALCCV